MTKVEEVAKAIWDSAILQPAMGPWPDKPTATTRCCYLAARAAIEALREPTDKMLDVGYDHIDQHDIQLSDFRRAWQAMLTAALGETDE